MSFKAIVINQVVYVVPSALPVPAALADKVLPVMFPGAWDKAPPVPNESVDGLLVAAKEVNQASKAFVSAVNSHKIAPEVREALEAKPASDATTIDIRPHTSRKSK